MPPRGSKRASSSGPGRSTKRSASRHAVGDAVSQKCHSIAQALAKANRDVLPREAAEMLAAMIWPCLAVEKERRHEVQASVVELIGRVLQEQASALEQGIEQSRAAVAGVGTDRTERQAALDRARGDIAGLQAAAAAKKEELATATATNSTMQDESKAAQKVLAAVFGGRSLMIGTIPGVPWKFVEALGAAVDAHTDIADKKKELQAAAEALELLKGSPVGRTAKTRASFKKLSTACSTYQVESHLADTVLKCLKQQVDARQAFDVSAIEELGKTLQQMIAVLEEPLKAAEAAMLEAQEFARVAQEAAAESNKAREVCQAAFAEARAAEKAGQQAVKAAEKRVASWLQDTKVTMDGFDGKQRALSELREGPLAAYEALRELQPEPEPVEEPAEPAAATEEPAEPAAAVEEAADAA